MYKNETDKEEIINIFGNEDINVEMYKIKINKYKLFIDSVETIDPVLAAVA